MAITGPATDDRGSPRHTWTIDAGGGVGEWANWPGGLPAFFGASKTSNYGATGELTWEASPDGGTTPYVIGQSSTSSPDSSGGGKSASVGAGSVRPVFDGGDGNEALTVSFWG